MYVTTEPTESIRHWRVYNAESSEAPHLIIERGQLQPETTYYVRVVAVGEHGDGPQSDIVQFETVDGGTFVFFSIGLFYPTNHLHHHGKRRDEELDDSNLRCSKKILSGFLCWLIHSVQNQNFNTSVNICSNTQFFRTNRFPKGCISNSGA